MSEVEDRFKATPEEWAETERRLGQMSTMEVVELVVALREELGFERWSAARMTDVVEKLTVEREGFYEEHRSGKDGQGGSPSQPTDRPPTRYVRLVGPWRRA